MVTCPVSDTVRNVPYSTHTKVQIHTDSVIQAANGTSDGTCTFSVRTRYSVSQHRPRFLFPGHANPDHGHASDQQRVQNEC